MDSKRRLSSNTETCFLTVLKTLQQTDNITELQWWLVCVPDKAKRGTTTTKFQRYMLLIFLHNQTDSTVSPHLYTTCLPFKFPSPAVVRRLTVGWAHRLISAEQIPQQSQSCWTSCTFRGCQWSHMFSQRRRALRKHKLLTRAQRRLGPSQHRTTITGRTKHPETRIEKNPKWHSELSAASCFSSLSEFTRSHSQLFIVSQKSH